MKRLDQLTVLFLILALLAGLFTLGIRFQADRVNRTVQIAMDYRDLEARQDLWQVPLSVYLQELKENGLQAVVLRENNVEELVQRGLVSVVSGRQMLEMQRSGSLAFVEREEIDVRSSYVFADDLTVFVRLQAELVRKLGEQRVETLSSSEPWGMRVEITQESLSWQRVGFLVEDLEIIAESGLDILPVLYNYTRIAPGRFEEIIQELEQYGRVYSVLFDGYSVTGFSNYLDRTALSMNYRNLVLGMVQPADTLLGYIPVIGTEELLERVHFRGARAYVVSRGITNNITTAAMVNRWINSIKEYHVHILVLRPFHSGLQAEGVARRNLAYVDALSQRIFEEGYQTGPAPSYPDLNEPSPWVRVLLMVGVGAGAVMLLRRTIRIGAIWQGILLSGVVVVAAATEFSVPLAVLRWGWALGGAILFPLLAMTVAMQNQDLIRKEDASPLWWEPLKIWAGATLITLFGAVIVAALITDHRFILDVDYFRGVKVSYLVPLALTVLVYFWYSRFSQERKVQRWNELKELIHRSVTFRDLLLMTFILGLLAFYVFRSGHVEISSLEVTIREWLDRALWIRPRTKEFVLGHPFLILAVGMAMSGHRKALPLLFLLGSVGQISIMNTFMHIRTPLLESLVRTANGFWLGALVGLAFLWVWNRASRWYEGKDQQPAD